MKGNSVDLAYAWKAYVETSAIHGYDSTESEPYFWAFKEMTDLSHQKPDVALAVILEILKITDEDRTLAVLAAGPLEELIVRHGKQLIDNIINLAMSNKKFYDLLQGIWGNDIDKDVWQKIEHLFSEER